MKIKRIEHVGVVVRDTETSRKLWQDCFGIPLGSVEENDVRKLALYPVGESMIELIAGSSPTASTSAWWPKGRSKLERLLAADGAHSATTSA